MSEPDTLVRALALAPTWKGRGLLAFAHPDDESIAAGGHLRQWPNVLLLCATDGAPANLSDAHAAGLNTREEYASARHCEFKDAMRVANIGDDRVRCLGMPDQGLAFRMPGLAREIVRLAVETKAEFILTHPYEGGHPDHDTMAFACWCATRLLRREEGIHPTLLEASSYFNSAGQMRTGEFLPNSDPGISSPLSAPQKALKKQLFDSYKTQQKVLGYFPLQYERFRVAPAYDFSLPPHPGVLWYEIFRLGTDGEQWRVQALNALSELNLLGHDAASAQNLQQTIPAAEQLWA